MSKIAKDWNTLTEDQSVIFHKIRECMKKLREKSMMYVYNEEAKTLYTTRGKHCLDVAKITMDLVTPFGGDRIGAVLMGAGHDFGHAVLAHTGESALGRFLLSPDKFIEWENVNTRRYFDHSKHSVVALSRECEKEGIVLPEFISNGIKAHSTGSKGKSGEYKSFEAECVMRADKIASSISDTQDLIKSGALNIKDKALLEKDFLQSEEVNDTVRTRIFGNVDAGNPSTLLETAKRILQDADNRASKSAILAFDKLKQEMKITEMTSENYNRLLSIFVEQNTNEIFEYIDTVTTNYIKQAVSFLQNPSEEQLKIMKEVIIEETKRRNEEFGGVVTGYQENYSRDQLFVPEQYDAILAAFRGIMLQKEQTRELGKSGAELEGLVETVARYVYANKETFGKKEPFSNWLKNEKGENFEWEETVAFALVDMTDTQFKEFSKSLLEKGAKDILKACKYRDPRDEVWLKHHKGEKLPYSEADFSTPEKIDKAFQTRLYKSYNNPQHKKIIGVRIQKDVRLKKEEKEKKSKKNIRIGKVIDSGPDL